MKQLQTHTVAKATGMYSRHSEAAMLNLNNGDILMIWQRFENSPFGSNDYSPSTLVSSVSRDKGYTWEEPRVLVTPEPGDTNVYSPNLIRLKDGRILFLYMRYVHLAAGKPRVTAAGIRISEDEGKTFSPVRYVWERGSYSFSNSCARRLSSDRILIPVGLSDGVGRKENFIQQSLFSDDDGETWMFGSGCMRADKRGCMEPFVGELSDGRLLAVMRTQLGAVYKSYSFDDGNTWTTPVSSGLEAPESCPYLVNIPGSDQLLVIWNHAPYDPGFASHFGKRSPLTAAVTRDGDCFKLLGNLEEDPNRAFTNPAVLFLPDGECLVTYWTSPYNEKWRFRGPIDLKLARFYLE